MIHRGNRALSGDFDFHRKRKPTVPMYADGLRLLGFGAFLTVWARVKKYFFDTLASRGHPREVFICSPGADMGRNVPGKRGFIGNVENFP